MVEANRQILENYGHPEYHALYSRGFVEFQLERVRETCSARTTPTELMEAAAYLVHGLARAQAFRDGNHRTAHLICQTFLHNNGLGQLSPLGHDDDELAIHLEGTGIKFEPALFGPDETLELLRHRYEARTTQGR